MPPPADTPRLTKKQKKASAFRDRKTGKPSKSTHTDDADELAHAVPVAEDQDVADAALSEAEGAPRDDAARTRAKRGGGGQDAAVVAPSKKRKRGAEGEGGPGAPAEGADSGGQKKRKRKGGAEQDVGVSAGDEAEGGEEVKGKGKEKGKQRLILFVGNLKYTTTKEEIQKHFAECDPPPTVRLLTPKQTRPGATVAKSKGCAFLEFTAKPAVQQALKLHQSDLDGRRINVELTAGGGGKSEARITKLKTRNKELSAQRTKRMQKEAADGEIPPARPQRFSTTSGEADAPPTKRTWTVGDVDDGETHRGGKSVKKRGAKKVKPWGTGVNAIPVG
ncbi:hypothetical protein BV25DRAFT_1820410 [Artomyces pyxidatus]|uniref:Uncharacterized protein n=1 Tax=Artomyces pyxidatus TaxID=48021 RepID=A0ACB8TDG2_9AGAM|nr:hypothetical protein BV25DRAFT_1820410 [Artomyces pyxidatus]